MMCHLIWTTNKLSGQDRSYVASFQQKFAYHYWIIDCSDECVNVTALFDLILVNLDVSTPLSILFRSRETPELKRSLPTLGCHIFRSESITYLDNLSDIGSLVEEKPESLAVKDSDIEE
jgi:hypothetical protein